MQLLPRYISAVRQYLPAAQQDDITTELSDSIQSQMEDKEAELGRPLTLDEQSAIIKPFGPPLLAASRYAALPALVGPALLPYYWQALKVVLLFAYAFEAMGVIVASLSGSPPQFAALWAALWATPIVSVGVVTIVFGVMEFFQRRSHFVEKWDPKTLPPARDPYWVPRSTSIFELLFNALFVILVLNIPTGIRDLLAFGFFGPAAAVVPIQFTGWWHILVPALVASSLVIIIVDCVNLVHPEWGRLRAGVLLIVNVILLVVVGIVSLQRPYVVPTHAGSHAAIYAQAVNGFVLISIVVCAIILLILAIMNLLKVLRHPAGVKL